MYSDYFKYSKLLEQYHELFYTFWRIGEPRFTETIPTAAVVYDKRTGEFSYLFNPNFWDELDDYNRLFVICHEILHIVLNHCQRTVDVEDGFQPLTNVALDVVVNDLLVTKFGFDKNKITNNDKICFVNTIFTDENVKVRSGKNFEYYYNLLKENVEVINIGVSLVDSHEFMDEESADELMGRVFEALPQEVKEDLAKLAKEKGKEAGKERGIYSEIMAYKYVPPKKKWETIIKNYIIKEIRDREEEQWARRARRMMGFTLNDKFLPADMEVEDEIKHRSEIWFFQDTSGSCHHLAERFLTAARSIPKDQFIVRAFCFDTEVYEIDLKKGELFGFGGTSFHIIETYIQKYIKEKELGYPKAVVLITDGYGDKVHPEFPERWHWLLSENYKHCIPEKCKTYDLGEFE